MAISSLSNRGSIPIDMLLGLRSQLDVLQRQLGTEKRAETHAELGADVALSTRYRAKLAALDSYEASNTILSTRLSLMQTSLERITKAATDTKSAAVNSSFTIVNGNQTAQQITARGNLDQMVAALNVDIDGRFLFSGRATDTQPVATSDAILNGIGGQAGLKQVIEERRQADLGDGLGRLAAPVLAGNTVSLAQDAGGHPFGFKIKSIGTTLAGASVAGPMGATNAVSVTVATQPEAGQTLSVTLGLPDGTETTVTLTAIAGGTPGEGQFQIGATAADTAANLQASLQTALGREAKTSLTAASALAAGNDFFQVDDAHPPMRIDGPPFASATALRAATATDTVRWYGGEGGSDAARSTASATIDDNVGVSYGARANEEALTRSVKLAAVFAAAQFDAADPTAADRYDALRFRISGAMDGAAGEQKIAGIAAEIAGTQTAVKSTQERGRVDRNVVATLIDGVEGISKEEVGIKILALQTRLQASYQATAILARLSLVDHI